MQTILKEEALNRLDRTPHSSRSIISSSKLTSFRSRVFREVSSSSINLPCFFLFCFRTLCIIVLLYIIFNCYTIPFRFRCVTRHGHTPSILISAPCRIPPFFFPDILEDSVGYRLYVMKEKEKGREDFKRLRCRKGADWGYIVLVVGFRT